MPHPVIGPMENHVQSKRRPPKPAPLVHGGISLQLSDGGKSPVLEAHPGSPVDISSARRPSLAASLASSRSPYGSSSDLSLQERSPRSSRSMGHMRGGVAWDGVAAKGSISPTEEKEKEKFPTRPLRKAYVGMQPFYIPAKVPEHEEVSVTTTSIHGDDSMSIDTAMDHEMTFPFETDGGTWITANPQALESRSSLSTNITSASTMVDGSNRYSHALTLDTSVASSSASIMSSAASTYSSSTNMSDIYGWEEELDRKISTDTSSWDRDSARRAPFTGRPYGSSRAVPARKRKGLLYRVLNMSGRRSAETETKAETSTIPSIPDTPNHVSPEQVSNNCI